MHVKGYIIFKFEFGLEESIDMVKVRYLVMDAPSLNNMTYGGLFSIS